MFRAKKISREDGFGIIIKIREPNRTKSLELNIGGKNTTFGPLLAKKTPTSGLTANIWREPKSENGFRFPSLIQLLHNPKFYRLLAGL